MDVSTYLFIDLVTKSILQLPDKILNDRFSKLNNVDGFYKHIEFIFKSLLIQTWHTLEYSLLPRSKLI
ncbi:hypothetical protein BLOT_007277 [Blomia tropicalis]|nr:hypothetical protein BLOT_007277 [Blomia tropicalis]